MADSCYGQPDTAPPAPAEQHAAPGQADDAVPAQVEPAGASTPVSASGPADAPAAEAGGPRLALEQMTPVIEDGILMILGPEGDPVPPQAFVDAAASRPDLRLSLRDGKAVRADRIAVVLGAQMLGRLGVAEKSDAWILTMLGQGEGPEPASEEMLQAERVQGAGTGQADASTPAHHPIAANPAPLDGASHHPVVETQQDASPRVELDLDSLSDFADSLPDLDLDFSTAKLDFAMESLDGETGSSGVGRSDVQDDASSATEPGHASGYDVLDMSEEELPDQAPEAEIRARDDGSLADQAGHGGHDVLDDMSEGEMPEQAPEAEMRAHDDTSLAADQASHGGYDVLDDMSEGELPEQAPEPEMWVYDDALEVADQPGHGSGYDVLDDLPEGELPDQAPELETWVRDVDHVDQPGDSDTDLSQQNTVRNDAPGSHMGHAGPDGGAAAVTPFAHPAAAGWRDGVAQQLEADRVGGPEVESRSGGAAAQTVYGQADVDPESIALVVIRGVPEGATLSTGTRDEDGSWSISPIDLPSVMITLARDGEGDGSGGAPAAEGELEITGIAFTEQGDLAAISETVPLADYIAEPVREAGVIDPGHAPAVAPEPRTIPLNIDPRAWADETFDALVVRDLPAGARLSAGSYDPSIDGWVLMPQDLPTLAIVPGNVSSPFILTLMGVALRPGNANAARVLARLPVTPA